MTCLLIDTSTQVCSAAFSADGECVAEKRSFSGPSHASLLGVFIQEMLHDVQSQYATPDSVAVSCGPGSYTGLRIGVSMAKGLCYGWNVPLIAVNTLELMAATVAGRQKTDADTLLCPMIDARRMEVYAAFFDHEMKCIRKTSADVVTESLYADLLDKHPTLFFGNGIDKCRNVLTHHNALFVNNIYPLAVEMIPLAEKAFAAKRFENAAYFEPFYLKEFVATMPKNKVF